MLSDSRRHAVPTRASAQGQAHRRSIAEPATLARQNAWDCLLAAAHVWRP